LHYTINLKRVSHQIYNFKLSNRVLGAEKSKLFDLHFFCNCCSFLGFRKQHLLYFYFFYLPGTDIKIWHGKTGKVLGNVDTNQLKNNMATISPNGRFIAAAAFTADVKVNISNY
jgi:hypothetical protein